MKINWNVLPTYHIDVKTLTSPYEICKRMNTARIDKYVYMITFKGIVIKFGMSADNSRAYGERLYRQIGHSKSWGEQRLVCSSGSDWRIVEEDFEALYGITIHKDDLKIKIWDATNYPFETINPWDEVYYMEQELIRQYKDLIGSKPIGNINDDKNIIYKAYINKNTWNNKRK